MTPRFVQSTRISFLLSSPMCRPYWTWFAFRVYTSSRTAASDISTAESCHRAIYYPHPGVLLITLSEPVSDLWTLKKSHHCNLEVRKRVILNLKDSLCRPLLLGSKPWLLSVSPLFLKTYEKELMNPHALQQEVCQYMLKI